MATAQASTPPPTPTTQRIPQGILQQPKIKRKVNFSVEETEYQDEPSTKRTRRSDSFLLRSRSESNILKLKETFRAIRKLGEIDGQLCTSSEEIRREYKDYGHLSSEERDNLRHKMSKIFAFLKKHKYELRTTAVMDIMPTSKDVFDIFVFLCNLHQIFPISVPQCPPLGTTPESRRPLIAVMVKVSRQLLLEKKLRNSDLINPVAAVSKSRVIDFFFQLVRVLEACQSPSRSK